MCIYIAPKNCAHPIHGCCGLPVAGDHPHPFEEGEIFISAFWSATGQWERLKSQGSCWKINGYTG